MSTFFGIEAPTLHPVPNHVAELPPGECPACVAHALESRLAQASARRKALWGYSLVFAGIMALFVLGVMAMVTVP